MQGQPAGGEATEHHGEPPPVRRRQSHPRRDRRRKRRLHGVVSALGPGPVTPPAPASAAQSSNCALRTSQRWWMEPLFAVLKLTDGMGAMWQRSQTVLLRWLHLVQIGRALLVLLTAKAGPETLALVRPGGWRKAATLTPSLAK